MKYRILLSAGLVLVIACFGAAEQSSDSPGKANPDLLANLKFRNLGPAVAGGRVTAVVGIPGNPNIYYVGSASGGVFKTIDGGITWIDVFRRQPVSSIGAIALAPSSPNRVWVGTGEANIRNDVTDGRGVYLSPDAGQSWRFMGLADAGQISRIVIDPTNPDNVFVAVMGHAWGPNQERGVFRTSDGGRTWQKVLYVNDSTGCADLVMEPDDPMVLLAATWQMRRYPWELADGGAGSGIYRSIDGGKSWTKLTKGLPEGPLGRIALAIAPSSPHRVYALVEAKKGMLWDSTDLGDNWNEVNDSHLLDVRPFYFSRIEVSPVDANRVYFLSFNLVESDDGGKTAHPADNGVHPDHHALWIDPRNPQRMIQGNDGGVYLSTDRARTWRFLPNLPIEQFYMVAADSSTPFNVCGGLQDNSAWCGPSSCLRGPGVTGSDWSRVAGGDGEYAVPAPSDPDIIYADSQNGNIFRFDKKTGLAEHIRPYLYGVEEMKPADLRYRFNWTSPIAVSPTNPQEVYLGANVIFKSTDGGAHWTPISADLTRNDKSKQVVSGGPIDHDLSGAETYDTVLSISLAPTDSNVIWAGTDDGLVQVTRDGGKTWTNLTSNISGAPEWSRVYQIGVSPFDSGTAYVAFDAHMLDNRRPYAYRTTDYGRTWVSIAQGLPQDAPVHVVREDPNQRGFLVAGTDTGLFFSKDSGSAWRPLLADFPTTPVYDIKLLKQPQDLVVATHGRGLFVLDDIRPLEELTPPVEQADLHLFTPAPAILMHHGNQEAYAGGFQTPNAPEGAVIDYFLKQEAIPDEAARKAHQTPVKITITDEKGNAITTRFGPSKAGVDRFVWDMRYDGPDRLTFEKAPPQSEYMPRLDRGPMVLPGRYNVTVSVAGHFQSETVEVRPDPLLKMDIVAMRAQIDAALRVRDHLNELNRVLNRVHFMQQEIEEFRNSSEAMKDGNSDMKYKPVLDAAQTLDRKLKEMEETVYNPAVQRDVAEDDIHHFARLHAQLQALYAGISMMYDRAPTTVVTDAIGQLESKVQECVGEFNTLIANDVAAYDRLAYKNGAPTLWAGSPIRLQERRSAAPRR